MLDHKIINNMVSCSLDEDIGDLDVTSALIAADKNLTLTVKTREDCVLCGKDFVNAVYQQLGGCDLAWHYADGDLVPTESVLVTLSGNARQLLSGERVALNFLQTLGATATLTRAYVDLLTGTSAKLYATRKTIPMWRIAQQYAVRCGGGDIHRMGLYDAFLIKENHIEACGSLIGAIKAARILKPHLKVAIEVEDLQECEQAKAAHPDIILLDNFSVSDVALALDMVADAPKIMLEASGGITFNNIKEYAHTGVPRISVGDITKNIKSIDLAARFKE